MNLVSLVLVLLVEQWRPLPTERYVTAPLAAYADFLEEHFNAGETHHGAIAWLLGVLGPVIAVGVVYWLLISIHPLLGLAFNIAILSLTMGFRQGSHHFTEVHAALKEGSIERAREALGAWSGSANHTLSEEEITRLTIEKALAGAHRFVFGVIFWFLILPGPTGAVLYRFAAYFHRRWAFAADAALGRFGEFARRVFHVLDWLPARLTAISFAIVGDFEDAIYCWRTQAARWIDPALGVVLAAGAGALGVRLGMPLRKEDGNVQDRPELGTGDAAEPAFLDSTVGLVWRALVLWLVVILILTIARSLS